MSQKDCAEIKSLYETVLSGRDDFSELAKHAWFGENKKKGVAKIYEIQPVVQKLRQVLAAWRKIWESERMKMVDYNGTKIRNFEKIALEKIWQKVVMQTPKRQRKTAKELSSLEASFKRGITIKEGNVVELEWAYINFRTIPTELYEFKSLAGLFLWGNSKLSGSLDLRHFPDLESLSVGDTKISELKNLINCTKLRELYIYNSEVAELPGVNTLLYLERIEAQSSRLKTISGLEKLPSLEVLNVTGCPIDRQKEASLVEDFHKRNASRRFTFKI